MKGNSFTVGIFGTVCSQSVLIHRKLEKSKSFLSFGTSKYASAIFDKNI
jgi:hypothetical protein